MKRSVSFWLLGLLVGLAIGLAPTQRLWADDGEADATPLQADGTPYADISAHFGADATGDATDSTNAYTDPITKKVDATKGTLARVQNAAGNTRRLYIPLDGDTATVWSSKAMDSIQAATTIQTIPKDATIKIVLHPYSDTKLTYDASAFGDAQFKQLTMVFGNPGYAWANFASKGIRLSDDHDDASVTDSKGNDLAPSGYLPIGGVGATSSAINYVHVGSDGAISDTGVGNALRINKEITITIRQPQVDGTLLSGTHTKQLLTEDMQNMGLTEQFITDAGAIWMKQKVGILNYSITLTPTVDAPIVFPEPLPDANGNLYSALVTGTGTVAGDTIYTSVDQDGEIKYGEGTHNVATVADNKQWTWLVPADGSQGTVTPNSKIQIGEYHSASDKVVPTGDTVTDSSAYFATAQGKMQLAALKALVVQVKDGKIGPELVAQIRTSLTQIAVNADLYMKTQANDSIGFTTATPGAGTTTTGTDGTGNDSAGDDDGSGIQTTVTPVITVGKTTTADNTGTAGGADTDPGTNTGKDPDTGTAGGTGQDTDNPPSSSTTVSLTGDLSGATVDWALKNGETGSTVDNQDFTIKGDGTSATVTASDDVNAGKYANGVNAVATVTKKDGSTVTAAQKIAVVGDYQLAVLTAPTLNFTAGGTNPTQLQISAGSYAVGGNALTTIQNPFKCTAPSGDWHLSVALGSFSNSNDAKDPNTPEGTMTMNFMGMAGTTQTSGTVTSDGQPGKVLAGTASGNYTGSGTVQASLNLSKTATITARKYNATVTWTMSGAEPTP